MLNFRRIASLPLLFCLLCSTACIRFTPSRSSIVSPDDVEGEKLHGEQAFYQFEQKQKQRLDELIANREIPSDEQGENSYKAGPGDVLEFNVFDVEEFNDTTARIRPSGFISLPLIGAVEVAGLTEAGIKDAVTERLSQFMHSPQVNVFISEYRANGVSVIGAVAKPGIYHLSRDNFSLMEILSEAGGRSDNASGLILLIPTRKKTDAQNQHGQHLPGARSQLKQVETGHGIEIYFDDLAGSATRTPIVVPLLAGDTIVVPEAGTVEIDGEVERPGSYPLSSRMTLLGAIAASGGLTYASKVAEVEVIRELEAGKKVALTVDLEKLAVGDGQDIRLRDGDVVRVPSHGLRFAVRQFFEGLNRLFSFGVSASPI